jgi:hypothetical protein
MITVKLQFEVRSGRGPGSGLWLLQKDWAGVGKDAVTSSFRTKPDLCRTELCLRWPFFLLLSSVFYFLLLLLLSASRRVEWQFSSKGFPTRQKELEMAIGVYHGFLV